MSSQSVVGIRTYSLENLCALFVDLGDEIDFPNKRDGIFHWFAN